MSRALAIPPGAVIVPANQPPVLNPMLYARLRGRFGTVKVTNQGVANTERMEFDSALGREKLKVITYGETYSVNCGFCTDSRQRLSVNYTYGTAGPQHTGEIRTFLWRCYNEECQRKLEHRKQLADWIVWSNGGATMELSEGTAVPTGVLVPCNLPGRCLHSRFLGPDHPMVAYFSQRRQGPVLHSTLVERDIHYCVDAPLRGAVGRAIIPLYFKGQLVGWQGRYLGDLDWKATGIQKYYNLPGLSKTLMLYEYDRAAAVPNRPYVVIVEGVTSAWAVGVNAVALFGKSMSVHQQRLLLNDWSGRPIFIYLDGSAASESQKIAEMLVQHNAKVIDVRLPKELDPGNLDQVANIGVLRNAAMKVGVQI